jgi:hypothetical protein
MAWIALDPERILLGHPSYRLYTRKLQTNVPHCSLMKCLGGSCSGYQTLFIVFSDMTEDEIEKFWK